MAKKTIKIKDPKKLIRALAVLLIVILAIVFIPKLFKGNDSVEKDIKKLEGQAIDVISKEIRLYQGETEILYIDGIPIEVKPGYTYNAKVIYKYQVIATGVIREYIVESGMTVKTSDTKAVTVTNNNTIKITEGFSEEKDVTVTIKYKGCKDASYTFHIVPDERVDDTPAEGTDDDTGTTDDGSGSGN